ncbi:MAG: amino acid permease [Candidatus Latescibacteria bacterium]|jgi:basic amino acid/polyamine antiporter, APA family|nr:amino acid permease [Candidatus Latescibacterota bacterium]
MYSTTDKKSKNGFERKLGFFPCTNIVIANMIGAGIFTMSGFLMEELNNPILMIVLWFIGGILALCGAICYGELGAAIPRAGGEYAFLSELYHPIFGFLSGWVSFIVGFSAPIAASAIGFSEYFFRAFPQFFSLGETSVFISLALLKKLLAIFVIAIFTFIHMRGIDLGARIQNYLTLLKVGLIVAIVSIGFSFGKGDFHHIVEQSSFSFSFGGLKTAGLSLMWIMFAYSGWNASTYIGSEIRNPEKNLPRSLLAGTGIVMFLYLCLNCFYLYAIPPNDMKGVISIGGLAVGNSLGKSLEDLFSLMISFALFSSLSAFIILGPRVYYSMAQDGNFFKFASEVHPRFKVPYKAIMLQGLISMAMVLSGTFDQILTYMGFSLGIFPVLAVCGIFKLRSMGKSTSRFPGYPVVQIVYILSITAMLVLAFFERPAESSIAIFTVLIGVPAYFVFRKNAELRG